MSTLNIEPDAMLSAIFSGRSFKMERDDPGAYFIDREDSHFRHILNFCVVLLNVTKLRRKTDTPIHSIFLSSVYSLRYFVATILFEGILARLLLFFNYNDRITCAAQRKRCDAPPSSNVSYRCSTCT